MRRLLSIAAFAVFLALIPAEAQRHAGGGRAMASAGHGGGFTARGSSGHAFGPHGGRFAAPPGRSGFGHSFRSSFRKSGFHQPGFDRGGVRNGRRGFRDRDFRFRHKFRDCFGCRGWRGYPWWYAGYYDPSWWWDSSSYDYDEDYERQLALAEDMDQRSLEQQRFLEQQDQDSYASSSASSSRDPASDKESNEPGQATVLVFRDQRQQEVQNYAIVGQTLWIFSPQRRERIPLAEIDLAASAKANQDRGVEFRIPGTAEGQ
jgi:hypothetical protein